MSSDNFQDKSAKKHDVLPVTPPIIWPDSRYHASLARYEETPPSRRLLADADLISGVIVGAADETVHWLEELCSEDGNRAIRLVLILYPAGPTRASHLKKILALSGDHGSEHPRMDIRVLTMENKVATDCEVAVLPPTVIQADNSKTDRRVDSNYQCSTCVAGGTVNQ